MNFFSRLFRLRPDDSITVDAWSATFMENSRTFQVVLDCSRCRQNFSWRLPVHSLFNPINIRGRHCRKNEQLPPVLVTKMRQYITNRKRDDPSWSEGDTWDDIEAQGERLI